MSAYVRVVAFIDWNSQLLAYSNGAAPIDAARRVFEKVSRNVARSLAGEFPASRFVVDLRLYHGWHKGFEPTANRKAIVQVVSSADFPTLSPRPTNVIFSGDVRYGDCLLVALERRIHGRLGIHLPNTLRSQDRRGEFTEKMVDTALASDLVAHAARDRSSWLMVVAEDDDFIPPLFAAEALFAGSKSNVVLLRKRTASPFYNLDDILKGVP
ncbi:hypothetical protein [Lysobacter sp. Root559]|uniref:hypothetical protein n=1 Tax=Lysobacter sp. Root559 TaxID=1736559 RepID=UPI0012FB6868|nr:hypothetical protein [Lysobacter sp. Root559]